MSLLSPEDKERIDAMGHIEMSRVLRFGSLLDFPWTNEEAAEYFMDRWNLFEGENDSGDRD